MNFYLSICLYLFKERSFFSNIITGQPDFSSYFALLSRPLQPRPHTPTPRSPGLSNSPPPAPPTLQKKKIEKNSRLRHWNVPMHRTPSVLDQQVWRGALQHFLNSSENKIEKNVAKSCRTSPSVTWHVSESPVSTRRMT